MTATSAQLDEVTAVHSERAVSVYKINAITYKHKLPMKDSHTIREKQMNQLISLKSDVKSEQNNTPKVVFAVVRKLQAETVGMKLENNAKFIDMVVKHRNLKRSHASALVDKDFTIATVKRAWRETVDREANLNKDVRATIKNANSNKKLAEDIKKKSYDMVTHVQYIKNELEDLIDKMNYL